jgi:hypothetical protein
MTTTARLNRFMTLGMPDEGADCESCSMRTGTEKVYHITSDDPEVSGVWGSGFVVLCDPCVNHLDVEVKS